jgi:hypothetical protein
VGLAAPPHRFLSILALDHLVCGPGQHLANQGADSVMVIDDEDFHVQALQISLAFTMDKVTSDKRKSYSQPHGFRGP